jgi:hypothetical protein
MTLIRLVNFLVVRDGNGTLQNRYQNARTDGTILFEGANVGFLSFIYQGATKNRAGDNLESTLVLANNPISNQLGVQAVNGRWQVKVTTCTLTSQLAVARVISTERWIVSSLAYDPVTVELALSSSIDAVGASVPNRVLTQRQVGAIPVSGQIQNR